MLVLTTEKPFAQGGNRLCFVHPDNQCLCIKVRRPDFSLRDRRRRKGFPKNLRPLYCFDDNREEFRTMRCFDRRFGISHHHYLSRCFGFEDTDLGNGLVSELIRDDDGCISQTLKKYLWDFGASAQIQEVINDFISGWLQLLIPSRDLLLHNIVVQMVNNVPTRLVVIDGFGSPGLFSPFCFPSFYRYKKAEKKIENFRFRVTELLKHRGEERFPGSHGLLLHDGRTVWQDNARNN